MQKKILKLTSSLMALLILLSVVFVPVMAEESKEGLRADILARDAEWSYLDNGEDLGKDWSKELDFADWAKGKSPLGFGDDVSETDPNIPLATELSFGDDENNKHMTTYFATEIEVETLEGFGGLEVFVHVDDGCVVYLNGEELFRRGIDEGVDVKYDTGAKFKPKEELFYILLEDIEALVEGTNVLTAEVHQDDGGSSDLWFEMGLALVDEDSVVIPTDWSITPLPNPEVEVEDVTRVLMSHNGDTATSMGFTWYTNQASVNSNLEVVKAEEGKEADFADAIKFEGKFQPCFNAPELLAHKATATDLEPGTTYNYRVGDAELELWSDIGSFRTDDKDTSFKFIYLADPQAKTEEEAILASETFDAAYQTVENAEFFLLAGDVVDTGSKEFEWTWLIDNNEAAFDNLPVMCVAGNHEDDPHSFYDHFNVMPAEGSDTTSGVYYSFDYGDVHFIMLNTNEKSREYRDLTPRQVNWLQNDSKDAAERGMKWQIAVLHKGPYTTSNHATDDNIMGKNGLRHKLAPIFAELGIDLVLQGHDHIYAASFPLDKDGNVTSKDVVKADFNGQEAEYFENPEGVVYLIPSTAGPKVYYKNKDIEEVDAEYYDKFYRADEHAAAKYATAEDEKRPPRSIIQNFIQIDVEEDAITFTVYEIDRNESGEPVVVDVFGIKK